MSTAEPSFSSPSRMEADLAQNPPSPANRLRYHFLFKFNDNITEIRKLEFLSSFYYSIIEEMALFCSIKDEIRNKDQLSIQYLLASKSTYAFIELILYLVTYAYSILVLVNYIFWCCLMITWYFLLIGPLTWLTQAKTKSDVSNKDIILNVFICFHHLHSVFHSIHHVHQKKICFAKSNLVV